MTEPSAGRPVPVPFLSVAGVTVTTAGAAGSLVAVEELSVDWGRSSVLAQPAPPTARVTLWDPSRVWATTRDLIGAVVTIGHRVTGEPDTFMFRGRIQSATVRPHTVQTVTGPVFGSVVQLQAASLLVDLANRRPVNAWPSETVQARANRIAAAAPAVLSGGVYFRSAPGGRTVNAVAAKDHVSLLEHLDRLADAAGGDRLIYDAELFQLHYIARRRYPGIRGLARLQWDYPYPHAGRGALLVSGTEAIPDAWEPTFGAMEYALPGTACVVDDDDLTMDASSRLSTVQVEYWDSAAAATARVEVAVPGTDETTEGVRSLSVSTSLVGSAAATTCATEVATLASQEGHRWALAPFTYRPKLAGGWHDMFQVQALLKPWEQEAVHAISGSWLPGYGIRPVFGIMGGTIRYADGEWHVTIQPAPIAAPDVRQHAVTFEELGPDEDGRHVLLHDAPHPQGFHPSVSLEDLRYAATGVGDPYRTIPADSGWDAL